MQVKFFDFINKAQIKAAKRLSAAIEDEPHESREDFFHVIQAAREAGVPAQDAPHIWASDVGQAKS